MTLLPPVPFVRRSLYLVSSALERAGIRKYEMLLSAGSILLTSEIIVCCITVYPPEMTDGIQEICKVWQDERTQE